MELILATNNAGKMAELQSLLPGWVLHSLQSVGFTTAIPEPYDTFEQNAWTKAQTIYDFTGKATMADDSGICIEALGGRPGVFSARYAGEGATDQDNREQLLQELDGHTNRKAYYKAVICLVWEGESFFFEGVCHGQIAAAPAGDGGFGYDPLFIPEGHTETFGQLPLQLKNRLSHRGQAVARMVAFLEERTA